jgi:hypothetical protein
MVVQYPRTLVSQVDEHLLPLMDYLQVWQGAPSLMFILLPAYSFICPVFFVVPPRQAIL